MNIALKIISIQHELLQAIGNTLDLDDVLSTFLRMCNSKLELNSTHVFLFQHNKVKRRRASNIHTALSHVMSLPRKKNGQPWDKNSQLADMVNQFLLSEKNNQIIKNALGSFHCYKMNDMGVFIIEYKSSPDPIIQQALNPVLNKLTISCKAAMNHQALIQEIKDRKTIERQIRHQASHDHLTNLLNRTSMEKALNHAIKACAKSDKGGALLLLDLVEFKNINDVMGHHIGDEIICLIANRLLQAVPSHYRVARFVGDEFMILMTDLPADPSAADDCIQSMIHHLIACIEVPIEVSSGTFSISCSVGYERFEDPSKTVQEVVKHASVAMYYAINAGQSKALAYKTSMSENIDLRLNYVIEIKNALLNNDFELYYQPQFDNNKNIIGAEALLRWDHPSKGFESPAIYIPIAEESDLIIDIGDFVLRRACQDIKVIEQLTLTEHFKKISINVSAKQLAQNDFFDKVMNNIQQEQIQAKHLAVEITEGIMMGNVEHSIKTLDQLLDENIECAIDDFGTGYSSLVYLKRLPAKLLKIDRAFVTDIHQDADNESIANMIIGLGSSLNMEVIAEGVENQQELDSLIKLGCYQYQGFFFSRPLPFKQFIELLKTAIHI